MPKQQRLTREQILDPAGRLRQLSGHGSAVPVDPAIPVKRYFRSGSEMERQARVYYTEGQLVKAFLLYNKFATLFVEKLPKHPGYASASPQDKARIKKLLKEAFPRAMELKEKLKTIFEKEKDELEGKLAEEEAERRAQQEAERAEEERRRADEIRRREEMESKQAEKLAAFLAGEEAGESATSAEAEQEQSATERDTSIPMVANVAYESVTQDQAVVPAREAGLPGEVATTAVPAVAVGYVHEGTPRTSEAAMRPLSLTATNPALAQVLPPPPMEIASPAPGDPTPQHPPHVLAGATLDAHLASPTASHVSGSSAGSPRTYHSIFQAPPTQAAPPQPINPAYIQPGYGAGGGYYQYPTAPPPVYGAPPPTYGAPPPAYGASPPNYGKQVSQQSSSSSGSSWGVVEVPVPFYHMQDPAEHYRQPAQVAPSAPPPIMETVEDQESWESNVPAVDRTTKPSYTDLSTSLGGGYRPVAIPSDTASRFQDIASSNTRRNVETCGILAGKLSQNTLRITHIIVPKQKGNQDSCETLNEEDIFDVQDKYDLITLGWIHTHPSQTAFMSSVDLHTHCSYQIMLDEAIAIVCAPRYSQVGVYMLTEPHGLDYITHCEKPGFHSHPKEPPLYEDCQHVSYNTGSFINVVDLR